MDYFAGLDVSLETVSICIVNAAGDILLELTDRARRTAAQVPAFRTRAISRAWGIMVQPSEAAIRAFCHGSPKTRQWCSPIPQSEQKIFSKCELPHTSRPISERC